MPMMLFGRDGRPKSADAKRACDHNKVETLKQLLAKRRAATEKRNCGTGAGGFHEGNTCAKGGDGGATAGSSACDKTVDMVKEAKEKNWSIFVGDVTVTSPTTIECSTERDRHYLQQSFLSSASEENTTTTESDKGTTTTVHDAFTSQPESAAASQLEKNAIDTYAYTPMGDVWNKGYRGDGHRSEFARQFGGDGDLGTRMNSIWFPKGRPYQEISGNEIDSLKKSAREGNRDAIARLDEIRDRLFSETETQRKTLETLASKTDLGKDGEPFKVFRGFGAGSNGSKTIVDAMTVGAKVKMPGFLSTSSSTDFASAYAKKTGSGDRVIMSIKTSKGISARLGPNTVRDEIDLKEVILYPKDLTITGHIVVKSPEGSTHLIEATANYD